MPIGDERGLISQKKSVNPRQSVDCARLVGFWNAFVYTISRARLNAVISELSVF